MTVPPSHPVETMAALSSTPLVSVAKVDGALQLSGVKAANPFKAGHTIAAHGRFDDGSETELGYFVVLRCSGKHHCYELAPLGCMDAYWAEHLRERPSVKAKVMARPGEKGESTSELLTRWRVIAEPGTEPSPASLDVLGKKGAEDAIKKKMELPGGVCRD